MSEKILVVDPERCTGCRLCEIICSVKHTGVSNPSRSRIRVIKWENEGFYLPMKCQQCQDAPCLAVCPKGAIYQDREPNRIRVNHDLCIGCRSCISACPFGAMGWDVSSGRVFKCDLCSGDPQCARFCDMKAVDYVDARKLQLTKMREAGGHYAELLRRHGGYSSEVR